MIYSVIYRAVDRMSGRTVVTGYEGQLHEVLAYAVAHVALKGEDVIVQRASNRGDVEAVDVFDLEADTKVDDGNPTFPVIVHAREVEALAGRHSVGV